MPSVISSRCVPWTASKHIEVLVIHLFLFPGAAGVKMKRISLFCLFALLTSYGHEGVLSLTPSYGERGSDLGIQVFQQVVRTRPLENVVLSPHGVASILGMLLPGAHGETRKQVLNALRYKRNGKACVWQWKVNG